MFSCEKIVLCPIGFVRTKAVGNEVKDRSNIAEIVLREELMEALEGIKGFSHLFIIFWIHEISNQKKKILKVHPRGRNELPLLGVFATRTPHRPNPIGLTLVELVKVEGNILTIRGLDAFNGTPVLDIKPFDFWDTAQHARVPEWWITLEKEKGDRVLR